MDSIQDVERILVSKKSNLTARRWVRSTRMKQRILDTHTSTNGYHLKTNRIDLLQTLEESIEDYLENPSLIDDQFK